MKENLKYRDKQVFPDDPLTPGEFPAEEDRGSGIPPEKPKEPVKPIRKLRKGRKTVQDVLGGDYLSQEWVTGNIGFILYLALLGMIYIANTYDTEKRYKMIEKTKNELKELRYEHITTKAALMFEGRQSVISKRAADQGLKEAQKPPFKIFYAGDSLHLK